MIFPVWTLKPIQSTFGMKHDQRVIMKFLCNERVDVRDIAARLQAQFAEHAYELPTIRFCVAEARIDRQDLQDKMRTRKPPLDDFDAKILAILYNSPFQSAHSIGKRLLITY
jgi:hypothetical protein